MFSVMSSSSAIESRRWRWGTISPRDLRRSRCSSAAFRDFNSLYRAMYSSHRSVASSYWKRATTKTTTVAIIDKSNESIDTHTQSTDWIDTVRYSSLTHQILTKHVGHRHPFARGSQSRVDQRGKSNNSKSARKMQQKTIPSSIDVINAEIK